MMLRRWRLGEAQSGESCKAPLAVGWRLMTVLLLLRVVYDDGSQILDTSVNGRLVTGTKLSNYLYNNNTSVYRKKHCEVPVYLYCPIRHSW